MESPSVSPRKAHRYRKSIGKSKESPSVSPRKAHRYRKPIGKCYGCHFQTISKPKPNRCRLNAKLENRVGKPQSVSFGRTQLGKLILFGHLNTNHWRIQGGGPIWPWPPPKPRKGGPNGHLAPPQNPRFFRIFFEIIFFESEFWPIPKNSGLNPWSF